MSRLQQAEVLGITDGAVVDVGGGTTGISILKDGEVIFTADEATGGNSYDACIGRILKKSFEKLKNIKKTRKMKMTFLQ